MNDRASQIAADHAELVKSLAQANLERSEKIASILYHAYCEKVGGMAFNGDPLPDWPTFRADPFKKLQSDAWVAVAHAANMISY